MKLQKISLESLLLVLCGPLLLLDYAASGVHLCLVQRNELIAHDAVNLLQHLVRLLIVHYPLVRKLWLLHQLVSLHVVVLLQLMLDLLQLAPLLLLVLLHLLLIQSLLSLVHLAHDHVLVLLNQLLRLEDILWGPHRFLVCLPQLWVQNKVVLHWQHLTTSVKVHIPISLIKKKTILNFRLEINLILIEPWSLS